MKLELFREPGSSFGEIVEAQYGAGYNDYSAALMDWATYNFLVQLGMASTPITAMSYSVLSVEQEEAGGGRRYYMTGDDIPDHIAQLPARLPVAVKSVKINAENLCQFVGVPHRRDIWHHTYLVPTLVDLGLTNKQYPNFIIHIDIPSHAVSNGKTGRDQANYFLY